MAAWTNDTTINDEFDAGAVAKSSTMKALNENIRAVTEGAAGAPRIVPEATNGWKGLEFIAEQPRADGVSGNPIDISNFDEYEYIELDIAWRRTSAFEVRIIIEVSTDGTSYTQLYNSGEDFNNETDTQGWGFVPIHNRKSSNLGTDRYRVFGGSDNQSFTRDDNEVVGNILISSTDNASPYTHFRIRISTGTVEDFYARLSGRKQPTQPV